MMQEKPGQYTLSNKDNMHADRAAGLTRLGDFHHKMRKAGRHCEAAQPTKQSIAISVLCASGLLPAAFLAVAMTMNL
jgi:hypothetical protein